MTTVLQAAGLRAGQRFTDDLLCELTGTVLEIGAGYGANFGCLRSADAWIGVEPDRRRAAELRRSARRALAVRAEVIEGGAERIPLPDRTVDAAVSTIALCSVRDQSKVLAEITRALRPGGRFVYFEHVAADRGTIRRQLERLVAPISRLVDHGCDPSRDTASAIARAGFAEVVTRRFAEPGACGTTARYIGGYAVLG